LSSVHDSADQGGDVTAITTEEMRELVARALAEDVGEGDVTGEATTSRRDLGEVAEALGTDADQILLDNMDLPTLRAPVELRNASPMGVRSRRRLHRAR
jgi:nicotinate-nucleotide pyrophosphorylase